MTCEIVTFYSYKGGTGRTLLMANLAWLLAAQGKAVLAVDWDLEAPGLHRYFQPFLKDSELAESPGLINYFSRYVLAAQKAVELWPDQDTDPVQSLSRIDGYVTTLDSSLPEIMGRLDFLGAGRQDTEYANLVGEFDWSVFFKYLDGERFLEAFRNEACKDYDYVLIDSRTGVSDTAGICTITLPDSVVFCFTYNRQSISGIKAVGNCIRNSRGDSVKLFPVPTRVDRNDVINREAGRALARKELDFLLETSEPHASNRNRYWLSCEIPYYPEYAFGEALAVFLDLPEQRGTLLRDIFCFASRITGIHPFKPLPLTPEDRDKYRHESALTDALPEPPLPNPKPSNP